MSPDPTGLTVADAPPGGPLEGPPAPARHRANGNARTRSRSAEQRPRMVARRVRRVVRRVDPWSILKVSLIFYVCCYVVALVAGVLLWFLADATDVVDNIESFVMDYGGFESFEFEPGLILQGGLLVGAVLVVLATGMTVLGAVLFNLISDLVGGIRLLVIEEDSARPAPPGGDSVSGSRP